MDKTLYHTITLRIPSEQVFKSNKTGKLLLAPTLTKTNNLTKRQGEPSIIFKADDHIIHPIIDNRGKIIDYGDGKEPKFHTITIRVPKDQIFKSKKTGKLLIAPTLTKTNNLTKRQAESSIILNKDDHVIHPEITHEGDTILFTKPEKKKRERKPKEEKKETNIIIKKEVESEPDEEIEKKEKTEEKEEEEEPYLLFDEPNYEAWLKPESEKTIGLNLGKQRREKLFNLIKDNTSNSSLTDEEIQKALKSLSNLKKKKNLTEKNIISWANKYDLIYKMKYQKGDYNKKRKEEDLNHIKKLFFDTEKIGSGYDLDKVYKINERFYY
jgi:hypothetical protein